MNETNLWALWKFILVLACKYFFFHSHPFTLSQGLILCMNYCETLIGLLDFILPKIHFSGHPKSKGQFCPNTMFIVAMTF